MAPIRKPTAKRIALFNHKGGVGKTTLTVNIADALIRQGKTVLIVDADPQCNITAYYLDSDYVDRVLDDAEGPEGNTLWSAIRPVIDSNGGLKKIRPYKIQDGLYLLHGDLKLSNFEQELTGSWIECFQRKTRGLTTTAALSDVVQATLLRFPADYVFYDIGPNIGALNRAVLLDCDAFIIPAACDLFSLRALSTLGRAISSWVADWRVISSIAPSSARLLPGKPEFIGYIPQRFRVYRGVVSQGHAGLMSRIGRKISSDVVNVLRVADPTLAGPPSSDFRLGEVKDFGQCATQSQIEGVPIAMSSKATDLQRHQALHTFDSIAKRIIKAVK